MWELNDFDPKTHSAFNDCNDDDRFTQKPLLSGTFDVHVCKVCTLFSTKKGGFFNIFYKRTIQDVGFVYKNVLQKQFFLSLS